MDRFVIREPRVGADYPQGNQMMAAFPMNAGRNNIMSSENVYYASGPYTHQFSNVQNVPSSNYMDVTAMNSPVFGQNMLPVQNQMMTGIDPRYLANYSDNSAQFIVSGQQMEGVNKSAPPPLNTFGTNYLNTSFAGANRNKVSSFTSQVTGINSTSHSEAHKNINSFQGTPSSVHQIKQYNKQIDQVQPNSVNASYSAAPKNINSFQGTSTSVHQIKQYNTQIDQVQPNPVNVIPKKSVETEIPEKEPQNQVITKMERLKALHKSGPRAFSGPVEKVLKWHKALQDIGVFVFYEIVAKCVSVRPGESCAKNLVIRDDSGPAMQVVYYEIDFMLPELKLPCTVRVIGRMMPGTCRLQAFSVRPATGDDVATLQRRAAVAAHQVTRLCKEFGFNH